MWAATPNTDKVKEMLTIKIKEQSLRTYLFAYSGFYDSLSLPSLAFAIVRFSQLIRTCCSEMFDMSEVAVHSIVSKMIINEEVSASHDQPTKTIVLHRPEPSRLQSLAFEVCLNHYC